MENKIIGVYIYMCVRGKVFRSVFEIVGFGVGVLLKWLLCFLEIDNERESGIFNYVVCRYKVIFLKS